MENIKATTEGVVLLFEDGEDKPPTKMIRGNGSVEYYELDRMGLSQHADLWGAGRVQPMEGHE